MAWLALGFALMALPASACRQALVLALDVSGSVDGLEYQQQVTGLASALSHPDIRAILLADTDNPVSIAVFEWSSQNHQFLILPWTQIDSLTALENAIARIAGHRKVRAGLKTALGTALSYSRNLLAQQPGCWRHTIDVSGDGRNNVGPLPRQVYGVGFETITVNALVVGNPKAASGEGPGIEPDDLRAYFEAEVIHGLGSFALVADGFADYARAMKIKLEKELQLPMLSSLSTRE
ncbi:DUF1194 domain-containing protein [Roseobacteraceae bacterium S113]